MQVTDEMVKILAKELRGMFQSKAPLDYYALGQLVERNGTTILAALAHREAEAVAKRCAEIADDLSKDELFLDGEGRFGAELAAATIRNEFGLGVTSSQATKIDGGYLHEWIDADGEHHEYVHPTNLSALVAPPAQEAVAEPVAWHFRYEDPEHGAFEFFDTRPNPPQAFTSSTPLYAAPPAVPDGYALVPVEPTNDMVYAAFGSASTEVARDIYRAMLTVAQEGRKNG